MKRLLIVILITASLPSISSPQISERLRDNWQTPSSSWIKIVPDTYNVSDPENDGVIQIIDKHNVTIDGDSVYVHGQSFSGYFILIERSDSVRIINFRCVDSMYYAVAVKNSQHVTIANCNFSGNKRDSVGYIDVWTDVQAALGGGVLMTECRSAEISANVMKDQNDGVALYHCDSIHVHHNDLSWNTSYGVRMYWTDSCSIHHNNCSHTNRLTDQSDCGAILLIVSNRNRIEHNDLTYSGDGIFLGQYGHHTIPNNNYFAYNDGSYSPHNAFEATFASGNVFKHNRANHSDYGFWLGYSSNTVVDSNEIAHNHTAGIAVDRGSQNSFRSDTIYANPTGIWLWEGEVIPSYEDWLSRLYMVEHCLLTGNNTAVSASNTHALTLAHDYVSYNGNGIHLEGSSSAGFISNCSFWRNTLFHIENTTPSEVHAPNNSFGMNDTLIIAAKIFDNNDDPSVGPVTWRPFLSAPPPDIQHQPPSDLTEPPSLWTVYASDGQTTVATWDSSQKTAGAAALKIATESGFDVMIQYWPEEPKIASWDLSGMRYLELWLLAANAHPFQQNSIRLGNESGGYYSYDAAADVFSSAIGRWKHLVIPLAGNATWTRTSRGQVALSDISYVQIHADTWDAGFTLWIDELSFAPTQSVVSEEEWPSQISLLENYPNPFNASTSIQYQVLDAGAVTLKICDLLGREVALLVDDRQERGTHTLVFDAVTLGTGVYFCTLQNAGRTASRKMLLVK